MKMYYSTSYASPVGDLLIVSDDEAIYEVHFQKQNDFSNADEDSILLDKACRWFDDYFKGKNPKIDFKLKTEGGDFQQKVWKILSHIPYGKTLTYGDIASQISKTMSAQAVGGAVGQNPIAILIPCHRVLGAKGKLTGYSAGLDKKMKLLDLEKIKYIK